MLSAADGGICYQTFADSEVNYEVDIGRNLVYAVEETTGLARPACNVPGCTHDSDACPAYIQGSATCYADGSEVYLYICLYKEAENTTVFRLEKTTRTIPNAPALQMIYRLDGYSLSVWRRMTRTFIS